MIGTRLDTVAWRSPWRFRSVAEKAALCFGLLACAVVLPPWPTAPLVLITVFVAARCARVPIGHLLRMLAAPLVFIVVAGISTAVTLDPSGPLVSTSVGAVNRAGEVVVRAIAATAAMMLFASTTPMTDIADSLRRIRVPSACVDVITVMYRMTFLLLESIAVVYKSQTARLGYSSPSRAVRSAGLLTASALVRAWQRAHALERGMAGRSLGMPLARPEKPSVSAGFVLAAATTNLVLVAVAVLALVVAT